MLDILDMFSKRKLGLWLNGSHILMKHAFWIDLCRFYVEEAGDKEELPLKLWKC